MNLLFLVAKIVIVAFFLVMFLRSSKLIWGIGLLTVTSAILLDAFLGTFGQEEMIEQFGFFFYAIAGALFAGGAIWLWGLLGPYTRSDRAKEGTDEQPADSSAVDDSIVTFSESQDIPPATHTHPVLYETITTDFGEDEISDLAFDMDYLEETSAITVQDVGAMSIVIIDTAERNSQIEELRLAVERIQTPLPPEHLPRIEKMRADTPNTVLRQYLVANCTLSDLEEIGTALSIEWDSIPGAALNAKARNLLLAINRGGRKEELIELLRRRAADGAS